MAASFFFYDLETSGFDPRSARVMQFAGQRTDKNLQPIGEPVNVLIKLTPDVLPEPDAILITGITPQQTIAEGLTEVEFLKLFFGEVVQPDTMFVGFNNIRFDDEFMRFMLYRNFYDAYEWQWKDACSRWDILDLARMTRALRPEGIEWPFAPDGRPANRLEFLTKLNKLDHDKAHDALSDVQATIAVARLIRDKQPDLFKYMLESRDKKSVEALVMAGEPFVYTSGRYPSATLHTSAAVLLAKHPQPGCALVYNLRHDPTPFLTMDVDQLIKAWQFTKDPDALRLPVKTLRYNRCPTIAPLGVMKDAATQQRLDLSLDAIQKHLAILKKHPEFAEKVLQAIARMDEQRTKDQTSLVDNPLTVDARLYDGFLADSDRSALPAVRRTEPDKLGEFTAKLRDERLKNLLPLYKARNYPRNLTPEEQQEWEAFRQKQLFVGGSSSRAAKYFARLQELASGKLSGQQQFLLEELQLYGQSIMPAEDADNS